MRFVPSHPEYPITLTQLPPETTIVFSTDGVTVTITDGKRTVIYRMERDSESPWTVEYPE